MSDQAPGSTDPVAQAVASLLRTIPDHWAPFTHDALSAAEQRALLLLVAAGLVERRFTLRVEMAGQPGAVDATLAASGERGLAEALEPMLAEMWTRWGGAFKAWKASEAAIASPFRITRRGPDEWRLTEFGVMARADLDVEAPSPSAAAFVGCRQRTLEFVLRTGHQQHRPSVDGQGRLVRMETLRDGASTDQPAAATPTKVALANAPEIAAAFRDALLPEILAALGRQRNDPSPDAAPESKPADAAQQSDGSAPTNPPPHVGGPHPDEYDDRVAWWLGKRIYLGRDTQVSRLFWLLARPVGRSCRADEVQRAVDEIETSERVDSSPDEIAAAAVRVRKAISKLRDRLRESSLDHHVVILREGGDEAPAYTMVLRHDRG